MNHHPKKKTTFVLFKKPHLVYHQLLVQKTVSCRYSLKFLDRPYLYARMFILTRIFNSIWLSFTAILWNIQRIQSDLKKHDLIGTCPPPPIFDLSLFCTVHANLQMLKLNGFRIYIFTMTLHFRISLSPNY